MKSIMISDETYNKLAAIKGKKSFTELLSEMADKVKGTKLSDIEQFFGIMSTEEADELQKFVAKRRKQFKVHNVEAFS
jgi:predicted CopG family antitoxin